MAKKLIGIAVIAIALFGIFGLTACDTDDSLTAYKTMKSTELQAYADAKGQDNYRAENWTLICNTVTDGKAAIEAAANKPAVDATINAAKEAIDEVIPELSKELESRIKADYLQKFGHELYFGEQLLNKFYGLYNGAAIFFIAGDDAVLKTVTISDLEFSYSYGWTIMLWKDGVFYDLENIEIIFDAGVLTQSDLIKIAAIHANTNKENVELTNELKNRIKQDYSHEYGYELNWGTGYLNSFYGLYNGAAVFFIPGEDTVLKTVIISGIEFGYNYSWIILVWKDGSFYNLEEIETIFSAGVLTQDDIVRIGAIHSETNGN
jgi:hypothetical protein